MQNEHVYPSQAPTSMTQMTQHSVESTSDISHDESYTMKDGNPNALGGTALVTPGLKQSTLIQYVRSCKKDERQAMKEEGLDEDDDVTFIKTEDKVKKSLYPLPFQTMS